MVNNKMFVQLDIADRVRTSGIEYEERQGTELALHEASNIVDRIV